MVTRVGMIGLSEGNGHPFSFSAIVNGYDRDRFAEAGWPVILDYLDRQPADSFGFRNPDLGAPRVTHAWTQDPAVTARLCAACRIDTAVDRVEEMAGTVDAVIVARDDWETHAAMAMPFLERGVPVFVDKPLSLDPDEVAAFRPHLEAGRLMSTSGMRYAGELDGLRDRLAGLGPVRLVAATVLNGLAKYGVHMLDALAGLGLARPKTLTRLAAPHQSYALTLADGAAVRLDCLGPVGKTFHLSVFAERGHAQVDLHDNFTAFRRTLGAFFKMVADRVPPVAPDEVVATMALLQGGEAMAVGETLALDHG